MTDPDATTTHKEGSAEATSVNRGEDMVVNRGEDMAVAREEDMVAAREEGMEVAREEVTVVAREKGPAAAREGASTEVPAALPLIPSPRVERSDLPHALTALLSEAHANGRQTEVTHKVCRADRP